MLLIIIGTILIGFLILGAFAFGHKIGGLKEASNKNNLIYKRYGENYDRLVGKFFGVCNDYSKLQKSYENLKQDFDDLIKEKEISDKDRSELGEVIIDLNKKHEALYIECDKLKRDNARRSFFTINKAAMN